MNSEGEILVEWRHRKRLVKPEQRTALVGPPPPSWLKEENAVRIFFSIRRKVTLDQGENVTISSSGTYFSPEGSEYVEKTFQALRGWVWEEWIKAYKAFLDQWETAPGVY